MCSFVALSLLVALSQCVTLRYKHLEIISKTKVELSQMYVTCGLNDIVIIAAPVVDTKSLYYLHKPNNDVLKLEIPRQRKNISDNENMVVKYINNEVKTIYPIKNRRVINPSYRHSSHEDVVEEAELKMQGNEFMIGPLLEEDHGNWVLSVYFKDLDDNWTELFQVITIEIVESVPVIPKRQRLRAGETLRLSFAYPIKHLQSCELTAPSSTCDRFYDRTRIDLDRCGYVVKNVTAEDEGIWRIIGVGKMVFEGYLNLKVIT